MWYNRHRLVLTRVLPAPMLSISFDQVIPINCENVAVELVGQPFLPFEHRIFVVDHPVRAQQIEDFTPRARENHRRAARLQHDLKHQETGSRGRSINSNLIDGWEQWGVSDATTGKRPCVAFVSPTDTLEELALPAPDDRDRLQSGVTVSQAP